MPSQVSDAPPVAREKSYDELLQERAKLNASIKATTEQCEFEQNDADLGIEDAKSRADALRAEIDALTQQRLNLQSQIDTAQRRIQHDQAARVSVEAAERPFKLALACQERIELAAKAQTKFGEACDLLRQLMENGERIIELDGGPNARRLFSLGTVRLRIARAFLKLLVAVPSIEGSHSGFGTLFLDCQLPFRGAGYYQNSLVELECEALDHMPLNLFQTRELAQAACARRDPGGRQLHVKPQGNYFTIVAGELKGAAAAHEFAKGRPV